MMLATHAGMNPSTDYTAAPACTLLATSCACCGRALLDAASVERGVGPDCAEKYGFNDAQGAANWTAFRAIVRGQSGAEALEACDDARRAANVLVHLFAARGHDVAWVPEALHALGFRKLAAKTATRAGLASVDVRTAGDELVVKAPYSDAFRAAYVRGRRWDRDSKTWRFPVAAKRDLWNALRAAFGGMVLETESGVHLIAA